MLRKYRQDPGYYEFDVNTNPEFALLQIALPGDPSEERMDDILGYASRKLKEHDKITDVSSCGNVLTLETTTYSWIYKAKPKGRFDDLILEVCQILDNARSRYLPEVTNQPAKAEPGGQHRDKFAHKAPAALLTGS